MPEQNKTCRVCRADKSLKFFRKNPKARDGYDGTCQECQQKAYNRRKKIRQERDAKDPNRFKEQVARYLWAMSKRRAKESGLEHTIAVEDIEIPDVCPVLLVPLNRYRGGFDRTSYSLDRVDSSRGYVPGNCRVLSWRANAVKSSLTIEEVERLLKYMKNEI